MESANLHHQNQIQSPSSSSSNLNSPPFSTSANWTQSFTLNNSHPRQKEEIPNHNFSNLMIQELGFHHTNQFHSVQFDHQSTGKIKEELSSADQIFPKFTEMLTSSNINGGDSIEQKYMNDILSEKLLLKTISSGFPINSGDQFSASNFYGRGSFSQIYPSINISGLNRLPVAAPPPISPGNFDMNLEALDLLASTRFSGSFEPNFSDDNLGLYKDNKFIQHSSHFPSCNPSKIPTSSVFTANEITEAKRPVEPKATQAAPKKSRLDSRASCPPLKVRKEKLGDRIAALQQLVAPFGKTDTASVLMEAIGYIKFLQNQVETLSVPYMKSSRNKSNRTTQAFQGSTMEETNDETKKDLRSRGLCLVPLSCMSYVTGEGSGGGIWPPPNFGGGT